MDRKLAQPGFGMAVVLALLFVGIQILFSTPLGLLDMILEQAFHRDPLRLVQNPLVLSIINLLAAGGAIGLGLYLNRMPLPRACPAPPITLLSISGVALVVLSGGILLSDLDNLLRWALPPPRVIEEAMRELFFGRDNLVAQFWLLVIVAPVTEEILFRGIILRGLLGRHRPWIAILLSALLFGTVHLNPWQFLPPVLLGLGFGWFYLRTGSVLLCIMAHALSNGLAMVVPRLPIDIPGLTTLSNSGATEFQPWWLNVAALVVLLVGLVTFTKSTTPWKDEPPPIPPVIPSPAPLPEPKPPVLP